MCFRIFSALTFLFLFAGLAAAQDKPAEPGGPTADGRDNGRPSLLAELNLSADQVEQIRQLNHSRRPQMQQAQRRLRDANHALDAAIYADTVNDTDVQARLREVQAAQGDLARLRFEGELAVRKLLTPEQLTKFRDLRRRFEEQMRKFRRNGQRPAGRGGQPPPGDFRN